MGRIRLAAEVFDPWIIVFIDSVSVEDFSVAGKTPVIGVLVRPWLAFERDCVSTGGKIDVGTVLLLGLEDCPRELELTVEVNVKAGAKFSELGITDEVLNMIEGKIPEPIIDSVDMAEGKTLGTIVPKFDAVEERALDNVVIAEQAETVIVFVSVKVAAIMLLIHIVITNKVYQSMFDYFLKKIEITRMWWENLVFNWWLRRF